MNINDGHIFLRRYVFFNALILFVFSFFIFPTTDTYYYWTWSQHLQLSYLDGPPMIAYLLWISTHVFGNSFFAIEVISLLSIYGSGFLLYKIVRLYQSNIVAWTAVALWIMYPFATTRFIAVSMTLDGLEVFFSLLIVYIALKWIITKENRYIYLLGAACGLGLLAKYNVGIVILALLVYFLSQKETRKIYLKYQTYIALLITLALFSPVFIWNYSHHWISFYYQLNSHKWVGKTGAINSHDKYGLKGVWFYLTSCFFGVLNVYLLILGYYKFFQPKITDNVVHENPKQRISRKCIIFLIWMISLFWLFESYTKHIGLNYMTTLSCLFAMLSAEALAKIMDYKQVGSDSRVHVDCYPGLDSGSIHSNVGMINWKHSRFGTMFIQSLLIVFSLVSLVMLVDKSRLHNSDMPNYEKYVQTGIIKRGI